MIATYRLQLTPELDLRAARRLVPYLRDLGVSHVYLPPSFQARAGSTHGYDVTDPTRISAELGGEDEFRALCEAHFGHDEVLGLYHARKLLAHERAIRLGWDGVHARLGVTKRFYDWFVPAIDVRDFALRAADERALDFLAVCRSR